MKSKALLWAGVLGALLILFQNFTPSSLAEDLVTVEDENDSDDAAEPVVVAEETKSGSAKDLCPILPNAMALPLKEIQQGKAVVLKRGQYYHQGELHLTVPVSIEGQGRGKTKLTICLGAKQSGVRIEAKNVSIKGISIELALKEKLLNSGSGEYGTGITMGRYFDRKSLTPVSHIRIENIGISRGRLSDDSRSFTGNALVAVGNVSDVLVKDVVLSNSHSIGFITHWGGQLPANCKYGHAYEIFEDGGEQLRCPIIKSFHPHNVTVDGLTTAPLTNALIMLSSSYNIKISNVTGSAPMALQILPGDEGVRYSTAAEKLLVGSNIKIENVNANIRGDNPNLPIVRIFSKGGSKWDQSYNDVFYKNIVVNNMNLNAIPEERANFRRRKFLFISKYGRGSNLQFNNMNFNDAGRARGYSMGATLLYSRGIKFSGLKTMAKNAVVIKNSENIEIKNSVFRRLQATATPPKRAARYYSRGIFIADDTRRGHQGPFPGYANTVNVVNNEIEGYDYGVWIASKEFKSVKDICDRVLVSPDNKVVALAGPYFGKECD